MKWKIVSDNQEYRQHTDGEQVAETKVVSLQGDASEPHEDEEKIINGKKWKIVRRKNNPQPNPYEKDPAGIKNSSWSIVSKDAWEAVIDGELGHDVLTTGTWEEVKKQTLKWLKDLEKGSLNKNNPHDNKKIDAKAKEQDGYAIEDLKKYEEKKRWSFHFDHSKPSYDLIIQPVGHKESSSDEDYKRLGYEYHNLKGAIEGFLNGPINILIEDAFTLIDEGPEHLAGVKEKIEDIETELLKMKQKISKTSKLWKESPARSKAQFRYMQGICNGSIEPPKGMTKEKACEYVANQKDYEELPEKKSAWKKVAKPNLVPPEGVRAAARRGIKYHAEGKAGDGFQAATLDRAHKIANGEELTPEHVRRMHSFFERHAGGRSKDAGNKVTPWDVAWLAWGGNAGRAWARKKDAELDRWEKSQKKSNQKDCGCWDGYCRVPGTTPCEPGSCEKCDAARKNSKWKKSGDFLEGYDPDTYYVTNPAPKIPGTPGRTPTWAEMRAYNYEWKRFNKPFKEQEKKRRKEKKKEQEQEVKDLMSGKQSRWKIANKFEGFIVEDNPNFLAVKDPDSEEIVASISYYPYEDGTFVEYLGYGDLLHPLRDAEKIEELKSRYPRLWIDLFRWARDNINPPYYGAFANQKLKEKLKAEPTGEQIEIPESYAEELGENRTEIPIDVIRRSNWNLITYN